MEIRYVQIEKEALMTTSACEKFSQYIVGKRILIETDHKPPVLLLGTKHLDSLPPSLTEVLTQTNAFRFLHRTHTWEVHVFCRHSVKSSSLTSGY